MNRENSSLRLVFAVGLVLMLLAIAASAQPPRGRGGPPGGRGQRPDFGPGQRPGPFPMPGGPLFDVLSSDIRPDGKIVKGAPYSATATTENVQMLADGTRITNSNTAKLFRDNEGRTRIELTLNVAGPFVVTGEAPRMIFINDVVAGTRYVLEAQRRLARKQSSSGETHFEPPKPAAEQLKTESLGKQVIEGIEAEGRRTSFTIPAGQIGNDRPIEVVSERWESVELNLVVLSKHKDPRLGETTYRLTNITRTEPDRSLFELPADYKIVEGGPPPRRDLPPMDRSRKPDELN